MKAVYQNLVTLDQGGVLLSDELDGSDDFGTGWDVQLFGWIVENGGEDGDELWSELDNIGVLVLVCNITLVIVILKRGEGGTDTSQQCKRR